MSETTLSRCDNLTTLRELTNGYTLAEAAAYERIAEKVDGQIIGTGGGLCAVSCLIPGAGTDGGHFLIAIDENPDADAPWWLICYERTDEDGQREWLTLSEDFDRDGIRKVAEKATALPLI